MSDLLGPQTFGEKEELVFLGREIGEQRNYSEEVAEEIDKEVRRLVREAHDRATQIVRTYLARDSTNSRTGLSKRKRWTLQSLRRCSCRHNQP